VDRETAIVGKISTYLHSMAVGVQDARALPRIDLERMRLAAEEQTNWLCMATGPGFLRPGFEYLTSTDGNAEARIKEFVFGASDAALMEFTDQSFRVILDDVPITRATVSSTVTNGDFSSAVGWTTTGIGGGTATISGGKLTLNAVTVEGVAQCSRSVTTATAGTEHALRIIVDRGPVVFRCGSTATGDDYISETELPTGTHSLAFTPAGTYYVQFASKARVNKIVDSIQIEAAGIMELPTPWVLADLGNIRLSQSADVCFVACDGYQQRRIERRSQRSWSVCLYQVDDGPFRVSNTSRVRLKPSALEGNITITASTAYFTAEDVGGLLKLNHTGQIVTQKLGQEDVYSDSIRVTGIYTVGLSDRDFTFAITGTWTGTVSLQRSYDEPDSGFVAIQNFTGNTSGGQDDQASNAIYYYRAGVLPGNWTSGEATITLTYDGGGGFGICRITAFNSDTSVDAEVLTPFKNTVYTRDWQAGEWSDRFGWPAAVALSDGRLWWSGADRIWGSISDAFASFDEEQEGDSGPISRSIATGGVNETKWLLSLQRLLVGTEGTVATVKSSSLDEPLTPTNFGIRDSSTTGAASLDPIKVDTRGIFVERAGTALLELTFDGSSSEYVATQISKLTTDVFSSGVKCTAIQRRPDTRIWLVMDDGSCVCMVYEPDQQVLAFIPIETDGHFESVAVLPALVQDTVYFSIRRTVNGNTVRYIEKMALDTETRPDTMCKIMDAFTSGTNGPASTTISVGTHLIGESVVVWADGEPLETSYGVPATFTVDGSGNITVPTAVTDWVAGLPYEARYKSARLAYGGDAGTAMLQKKAINSLGLILTDFARAGLKYGPSFDLMDSLPLMTDGETQPEIVLSGIRDEEPVTFAGEWTTDSRLHFKTQSPYPATVLGIVIGITTN
jgi:hypothetical protein